MRRTDRTSHEQRSILHRNVRASVSGLLALLTSKLTWSGATGRVFCSVELLGLRVLEWCVKNK